MLSLAGLEQDVTDECEAQVDYEREVLAAAVGLDDDLERLNPKVVVLNSYKLIYVVLKLVEPQLLQIFRAHYHVLDQLGDFLVEFYYVRFSVNEVLDGLPVLELSLVLCLLRASPE